MSGTAIARPALPYASACWPFGSGQYAGYFVQPSHGAKGWAPLVVNPSDDRSSIAIAYTWATRIMVVSLEMVLPGLGGYWLDQLAGTKVLFMLVGFALGGTAAAVHLIQLTRAEKTRSEETHPVDD